MRNKREGLPLGYPAEGTVTITKTPVLNVCEAPGCTAWPTCIMLSTIETEDHHIHIFIGQACDRHAEVTEEALRAVYKWRPCTTTWRGQRTEKGGHDGARELD